MSANDSLPDDVATLKAMPCAERAARLAAEAGAQARTLLIEKLKLTIKKLRHERFGQSSKCGALLDQLELQLADLEGNWKRQPRRLGCRCSNGASRRAARCPRICISSI
jgi:transposase